MLIVQKFGGSSLADLERLRRAAGICADARRKKHDTVVVVSAMGDSTDDLLDIAHRISPKPSPRELDALLCCGEQQSAALMAIMLRSMGLPALSFTGWQAGICTDSNHGDARIERIEPDRIRAALSNGFVAVVSGFQGINETGDLITLGRGGSDTSAVALAAALGAERCEIYTDVPGIFTADPRQVKGARLLPEIDFRDMLRLARCGSQVLHPRSVALAMERGVDLRLLSSFEKAPGSAVRFIEDENRPAVAGVTRDAAKGILSIVGKGADKTLERTLIERLASGGITVSPVKASEGCITLRPERARLYEAMQAVHDFLFS